MPSSASPFRGFCASACSVTSDCPDPTARCAQISTEPGQGRVCVTSGSPLLCEGLTFDPNFTCNPPAASCPSAQILARPFVLTQNRVCGTEYVFCPTGCNPQLSPPACN
jgi:hypothetical protein